MDYMFYGCSSLIKLDLSSFINPYLAHVSHLFEDCYSLSYINISNFNGLKIMEYDDIFEGINQNGTIIYNSSLFNEEFINYFPDNWAYVDINNISYI